MIREALATCRNAAAAIGRRMKITATIGWITVEIEPQKEEAPMGEVQGWLVEQWRAHRQGRPMPPVPLRDR